MSDNIAIEELNTAMLDWLAELFLDQRKDGGFKDGNPVKRLTDVAGQPDHYEVTAGLVSRAWPDEIHAEDYHRRVFHFGYKD